MSSLRLLLLSTLLMCQLAPSLAQLSEERPKPVSATSPFPEQWDAAPQYHDCVIAMRIVGLSEKSFYSIVTALFRQYLSDEMRLRNSSLQNPDKRQPIVGFSNRYSPNENGGTGFIRLEFRCKSEKEVAGYLKDYEGILTKQVNKTCASAKVECVTVLTPQLEEKVKRNGS